MQRLHSHKLLINTQKKSVAHVMRKSQFEQNNICPILMRMLDFLRYIIQRKLEPKGKKGKAKGAKGANNKVSSKESILSRITSWFVQVETEKSSIPRIRIIIAKGESENVRIITITKKTRAAFHSTFFTLIENCICSKIFLSDLSEGSRVQKVKRRWVCTYSIVIVKDRDDGKAFFILKSIFLYMYTKIWRTSWKSWKTSSTMLLCLDLCHRCHTLLSPLFT